MASEASRLVHCLAGFKTFLFLGGKWSRLRRDDGFGLGRGKACDGVCGGFASERTLTALGEFRDDGLCRFARGQTTKTERELDLDVLLPDTYS